MERDVAIARGDVGVALVGRDVTVAKDDVLASTRDRSHRVELTLLPVASVNALEDEDRALPRFEGLDEGLDHRRGILALTAPVVEDEEECERIRQVELGARSQLTARRLYGKRHHMDRDIDLARDALANVVARHPEFVEEPRRGSI